MNPLFSIITVCYNSDKTIAQTIESVLNQTFQDFEYLIIDGGSTDGTLDIIKKYEFLMKGKLKWISEPDKGIYDAMNKGIKLAQGEIIGIINSDDWYELDCLGEILKYINADNKNGIYYGLMMNYWNNNYYKVTGIHHDYLNECMISHSSCFISKYLYEQHGLFDLNYQLAADYDLILRFKNVGADFYYIPKILANFRMGGSTDKRKYQSMLETYKIYKHNNIFSIAQYVKAIFGLKVRFILRIVFKWIKL